LIAEAGQKVILVDADMRKGYSHKQFNLTADHGFSCILIGDLDTAEAIKATNIENLDFISRGKIPPNQSELLIGEGFSKLITELSAQYDLVIIDTPPILAVTDPLIIVHHAGTALMQARLEQSRIKEIAAAAKRFELNGIDIKGVIFNDVEKIQAVTMPFTIIITTSIIVMGAPID
jgi:tyrosine-protein kinase Etk/Wzc